MVPLDRGAGRHPRLRRLPPTSRRRSLSQGIGEGRRPRRKRAVESKALAMRRRDFIAGLAGTATLQLAALAQDRKPVVGLLSPQSAGPAANRIAGFLKGLAEQGYVDGDRKSVV